VNTTLERNSDEPWRWRLECLTTVLLHSVGFLAMPVACAAGAVVVFGADDLEESSRTGLVVAAAVVAPLLAVQIFGVVVRARRLWCQRNKVHSSAHAFDDTLAVLVASVVVLTRRGGWLYALGLIALTSAIATGYADLACFSVVLLGATYALAALGSAISAVGVRLVDGTTARRSVMPTVAMMGTPLRDTFVWEGVVPRGFGLRLTGVLPARLGGESRLFCEGGLRREVLHVQTELPPAPRGVHQLPPATVVLEDLLGLTAVVVGVTAAARCKVLPMPRRVHGAQALSTAPTTPDEKLSPHPRPREDLWSLRTWRHGDDARRIHWRQSVRAGEWLVRTPDQDPEPSREVHVVLDTAVDPALAVTDEDHAALQGVLDVVVDAALGIVRALLDDGHDVVFIAAVPQDAFIDEEEHHERSMATATSAMTSVQVQALSCRTTRESAWRDLGARATPQSSVPLAALLVGRNDVVIVTAGLAGTTAADILSARPAAAAHAARSPKSSISAGAGTNTPTQASAATAHRCARVVVDAVVHVPSTLLDVPPWSWRRLFFHPHPAGSNENRSDVHAQRRRREGARVVARSALLSRLRLRALAPTEGDLLVVRRGGALALVPVGPPVAAPPTTSAPAKTSPKTPHETSARAPGRRVA
jgi:uncharacterized protein (DUF58 family)